MANTKVTGDLIAAGTITTSNIANSAVTTDILANSAVTAAKLGSITTDNISEGTNLFYTDARVGTYLSGNGYDTATNIIATITDSAPTTLDTLNELAAALGDDPNFATTVTNSIATKLPLAGGTLTGNLIVNANVGIGTSSPDYNLEITSSSAKPTLLLGQAPYTINGTLLIEANEITSHTDDSDVSTVSVGASRYRVGNGDHRWYTSPSTEAGFSRTFTERMRIDASGRVSINGLSNGADLTILEQGVTSALLQSTGGLFMQSGSATSLVFRTDGANERMRITSSGNVGIGTSAPSNTTHIYKNATLGNLSSPTLSGAGLQVQDNANSMYFDGNAILSVGLGEFAIGSNTENMLLYTNGSERMRITSGGNVGIGSTAAERLLTVRGGNSAENGVVNANSLIYVENNTDAFIEFKTPSAAYQGIRFTDNTATAGGIGYAHNLTTENNELGIGAWSQITFRVQNVEGIFEKTERMRITSGGALWVGTTSGFNYAGGISAIGYANKAGTGGAFSGNNFNIDWTGSANLYIDSTNLGAIQTSSDYRIKRNIETQIAPALDRINQLRPVTYQKADYGDLFKADDEVREGFIAHELSEIIPSAVEGEKDAENQIQSLKLDALCSVMVKAIQELKEIIDNQQQQINDLKAQLNG